MADVEKLVGSAARAAGGQSKVGALADVKKR